MIYSDNIYCNYSHFYNALFNNKIKSVKHIENSYTHIILKNLISYYSEYNKIDILIKTYM